MRSIKEPMDGVLQAGMVALAFATAENFLYTRGFSLWVLPWRAVLATTGHLLYASIWGYIFGAIVYEQAGKKLRSEYRAIFAAVLPAAILHRLYNFMLDLGRIETALRYNPESPLLNQRLALLYIYYRDFKKALQHVQICRKNRPTNPYFLCVEAVLRVLSGEILRGAELMEGAYPRLSGEARTALHKNVRRVIFRSGQALPVPHVFDPEYPLTSRFFDKIAGRMTVEPARTYRRVPLSRRRYLARVG